jgi:hypothetical protein
MAFPPLRCFWPHRLFSPLDFLFRGSRALSQVVMAAAPRIARIDLGLSCVVTRESDAERLAT